MKSVQILLSILASLGYAAAQGVPEPHLIQHARYHIQYGDKLDIAFRYTPDLNQTVTVEPDGYINLVSTGELKVSEMTLEQATSLIQQVTSSRLRAPQVTITLKEFHKPYFVVAGEVKRPGRFDMDTPTTAFQALLLAGGMDTAAQSSQVVVFRRINAENDEVRVLDLHNMKKTKNLEHDMMLEPGDMVLVPKDRIAKIDRIIKATNIGLYLNPADLGL